MKWFVLIYLVANLCKTWAKNDNYNFTYAIAMRCKEHICQRGYNYDTFYRIDEKNLQHATVRRDNKDVSYFEMHMAIQAASNGHILFSSVPKPAPSDPVYEIVVGGGGNKFTELRLNQKRNAKVSTKTTDILSTIDFTAFYIKISDDGLVEFGKEGDKLPLLSYYDANTLPIKYFSFASWTGVEAKFLYDCPAPGDSSDALTPDSQAVEPKLSNSDELKRQLLMYKMPSIPPDPIMQVKLGIKVLRVMLNSFESRLKTTVAVVMSWTDNSMAWNPSKFNGTSELKFRQGQIWRPVFFVYNSDNTDTFDTRNPDLISMNYSGEATFHFQAEITTWCKDDGNAPNKWPYDEYSCLIVIEPWEVHEVIAIDLLENYDPKMTVFADVDEAIQSEWEFTNKHWIVKPEVWGDLFKNNNNITHQSDRYFISLELKRSASSYNIVFYTPLLSLMTFVLMSFWSEPLEMARVHCYAGVAVIICLLLSNINFLVPTHNVPTIQILYETVLDGVLTTLLIQVFLMTALAEKLCKTSCVNKFLSFSLLRTVFCLPPIKVSLSDGYSRQEDADDDVSGIVQDVEEMERDQKNHGNRKELAEIIDKILFIFFSIVFAVMLAANNGSI